MNANELRVGNLLNEDVLGNCEVSDICEHVVMVKVNNSKLDGTISKVTYTLNYGCINPIKLNEKWLLDFGFKHKKCGISGADMWQGLDFWDKECDMAYLTLRGDIKYGLRIQGFINSDIKYVHQLQNLYFALTGKELTIINE